MGTGEEERHPAPLQRDVVTDEIRGALGRVVVASARLELRLRMVVEHLTVDDDVVWYVWEGQSADWLLGTATALLKAADRLGRSSRVEDVNTVLDLLGQVKTVFGLRNHLVHGVWVDLDQWGVIEQRPPHRRHGPDTADEPVVVCYRSRRQKDADAMCWSARDVDDLADQCWMLDSALRDAMSSAGP
jgi:hypothetical protein